MEADHIFLCLSNSYDDGAPASIITAIIPKKNPSQNQAVDEYPFSTASHLQKNGVENAKTSKIKIQASVPIANRKFNIKTSNTYYYFHFILYLLILQ